MRKLLLLILSLLLITTLTGCGTTKTSATTPDNTPKTAEDKKLMEEIKQHENLTDADMKKIQADAEKKYKEFTKDRAEYKKGVETKTIPKVPVVIGVFAVVGVIFMIQNKKVKQK